MYSPKHIQTCQQFIENITHIPETLFTYLYSDSGHINHELKTNPSHPHHFHH